MSRADRIWQSYAWRMGLSPLASKDAQQQYGIALLRDVVLRLDVILDDEGVDHDTAVRVIRCLLYGTPSDADAIERLRVQEEMVKLVNERTLNFAMPTEGWRPGE